jgi:hypothetical protein
LRTRFGIAVPLHHSAVPLLAAAVSAAAALALVALPLAEPIRLAVALIAGLAIYWAALRLLLKLTGESLALTHFVTHASEAEAR